jgi:hypothetical protein
MTRYFCTYFDRRYISRGLALIQSLRVVTKGKFQITVLCLDEETHRTLAAMAQPEVDCFSLQELEEKDEALLIAARDRSRVEYYWTLTPSLVLWLLQRFPERSWLTYVDADLFFFSSLDSLYDERPEASVFIHAHRYPPRLAFMEANGKYNVGMIGFRNNSEAQEVAAWWRERCLESCHLDIRSGQCGDQMYLNEWPERFPGVHVLQDPGVGLAPWNIREGHLQVKNGQILLENHPVVFFHFHGFRYGGGRYLPARRFYISSRICRIIYDPYLQALQQQEKIVRNLGQLPVNELQNLPLLEWVWQAVFGWKVSADSVVAVVRWWRQGLRPQENGR